jgi:omega-amidase
MQDLSIALVQANQIWEDKGANLRHFEALIADHEADVFLLPEMFNTAFSMNAVQLAEKMEDSPSLLWLRQLAKKKDAAIYTSLIIEENGYHRNRGVFVYPDGRIRHYDKRKSFGLAGEQLVFTQGIDEQICPFRSWNFQLQICYDLRFPELARNRIEPSGDVTYDVLLYVANWPDRRALHWQTLLKARAIENQCYVIGVNRVGEDENGMSYAGHSACIDALGIETSCEEYKEMVKIVRLNKSSLNEVRTNLPFLKDR